MINCSEKRHLEIVKSLRIEDDIIRFSIKYGYFESVKWLFENGAKIRDDYNLRVAVENGRTKIVKYLVSQGAKVHGNILERICFKTSSKKYIELLKYLINNGASTENSLVFFIETGYLKVIKYLMRQGAEPTKNDLKTAMRCGYLNIVKYLRLHGVTTHEDMVCAATFDRMDMLKYFIERPFKEKFEFDQEINDVLFVSSSRGNFEIVNYLFEKKLINDDNIVYSWAICDFSSVIDSAIYCAASNGNLKIVKYLSNQGANIHNHVLYISVKNGYFNIVKYLVEKGVELEFKFIKIAFSKKYMNIVFYMIEKGIDIDDFTFDMKEGDKIKKLLIEYRLLTFIQKQLIKIAMTQLDIIGYKTSKYN